MGGNFTLSLAQLKVGDKKQKALFMVEVGYLEEEGSENTFSERLG